jgi:uncharacterized repeat protein (TIGR01451 family)
MKKKTAIGRTANTNTRHFSSLVFGVCFFVFLRLLATSAYADIENTARATGTSASGPVQSNTVVVSVPLTPQNSSIAIVKSVDNVIADTNANGYRDAGDTINYTLVVENTGNVSLNNVIVTDLGATIVGSPVLTLDPQQTATLTASHIITTADIVAGFYDNQATATGTPNVGPSVSDLSHPTSTTADQPTRADLTQPTSVAIDKIATLVDVNSNTITDVGDRIDYAFNITNTGSAVLTNLTLTDPAVPPVGSAIALLAPGASNNTAYTSQYILTQTDIDAGQFVNKAQVDATTPMGTVVSSSDIETTTIPRNSAIAVIKRATPNFGANGTADVGDTISYAFEVTNTGNTALSSISITDQAVTVSGTLANLAPGATDTTTFTAQYTVTQADVDAGSRSNQATVNATSPTGPVTDLSDDNLITENDPTITALPAPAVALLKTAIIDDTNSNNIQDQGDTVNYSFSVKNTGNVPLTNVIVTDAFVTMTGVPIATLAPGATDTTSYRATYILTQADADAGFFDNQAGVTAKPPSGPDVGDLSHPTLLTSDGPTRVTVVPSAKLTLVKAVKGVVDVNGNNITDVGDRIDYSFLVTNAGSVTLSNITITDPDATLSGAALPSLAPGASNGTQFEAQHILTQADIDAARFVNTATVTGFTPAGNPVSATDDETAVYTVNSSLQLEKTAVLDGGVAAVDGTVTYTFTVTNTGATTLRNVRIDDPLLAASNITSSPQAMINLAAAQAGADPITTASISPREIVSAEPLTPIEEIAARAAPPTTFVSAPHLSVPAVSTALHVERDPVVMTGDSNAPKAGDEIGIVFRLNNAGEAPLTSITAEQANTKVFANKLDILANNQSDVGSILLLHVLTAEEAATGTIATPARITALSRNQQITVELNEPILLAEVASYDEIATAAITPASAPSLAPGASIEFKATHKLTQDEIDAGVLNNTATALASGHDGEVRSSDSATTTLPATPAIAVVKKATPNLGTDGIANVGDTITYAFTVTNTGNVRLNDIAIADPKADVSGTLATLAAGASNSTAFTATYEITQEDIDAGRIENQATVTGRPVVGDPVTDLSDDEDVTGNDPTVVTIELKPGIAVTKAFVSFNDINTNTKTDFGDTASYRFTVTNTGNTTLTNVTATDPQATVVGTIPTLAPAGVNSSSITATVVLTQAMIDAGEISNQATVSGKPPIGLPVTDLSHPTDPKGEAPTVTPVPQSPGIALIKTITLVADINNNGRKDLGDIINYAFTITNTGNVTLTDVIVTDDNAAMTGSPIVLAPGASDTTTFKATHLIVPGDVALGKVVNQAKATGNAGRLGAVSDTSDDADVNQDDPTVQVVFTVPGIAVVKTVSKVEDTNNSGATDAGDTITYAIRVKNTGDTNLSNVTITELMTDAVVNGGTLPTLLVAAEDTTTFTATYIIKQTDVTAGGVSNQVRAQGISGGGQSVNDLSDDLELTEDGQTTFAINNQPAVALIKTIAKVDDNNNIGVTDAGDVIHYAFTVSNEGNVPLKNITVTDAKAVMTGGPIDLAIGGSNATAFTATRVITQEDVDKGGVENQAVVNGFSPVTQTTVTDLSDDNSAKEDNVTTLAISKVPKLGLIKTLGIPFDKNGNGINDVGDTINYVFTVTNTGNVPLTNITLTDTNATVSGVSIAELKPGKSDSTTFKATHVVTVAEGTAGRVENTASVRGTPPTGADVTDLSDNNSNFENDPTIINVVLTPPNLAKTAQRTQVSRGDVVPYTIRATNVQGNTFFIRDIMPPGFQYVAGSATLNGVVAITPAQSGNTLTFTGLTRNEEEATIEIKLKLIAAVTSKTGRFVNKAEIVDTNSGNVAGRAEAAVTIKEEHVFDCSDIIGRVFDDLNGNGYADDGEPGLPAVRIVTVNGRIITTDDKGRFSVPCADVPEGNIGSNFILKLDPKSLPAGYQLTTENPRMVRVTPGKVVKLNFGAQGTRDVQLDVRKDAFVSNGIDLTPKWTAGLDRLVTILKKSKGNLDIVYRCGVYAPIADERLEALEEAIKAKWEEEGSPHKLRINSRVECGK